MNRHEATRRVMQSIFRRGTENALRYVAPDGSRPVVVCTPNEYLSEVSKRVDAAGGSANVVLAETKRYSIIIMESVAGDAEDVGSEAVNADISMGMFFIRAKSRRGKANIFHIGSVNAESQIQAFDYA
ncbi:hypothetical protein ACIPY5_12020 [Microbacterium sp. NPDC089698]|uniref:hypothetical protein n=1 Tax=Microbacterium sp. NPDC089698 TaxID=3364200 RepID=UPI0038118755